MDESKKASSSPEADQPETPVKDPVGQFLIVAGAGLSAIGMAILMVKLANMMDWVLAGIIAGLGVVLLIAGVVVR